MVRRWNVSSRSALVEFAIRWHLVFGVDLLRNRIRFVYGVSLPSVDVSAVLAGCVGGLVAFSVQLAHVYRPISAYPRLTALCVKHMNGSAAFVDFLSGFVNSLPVLVCHQSW